MRQPRGTIMQMGYIVRDLEESMEAWSKSHNIGKFTVFEDFEIIEPRYRGELMAKEQLRAAMGYSGNMMVELIQQVGTVPSVYQEVIAQRGYGFHHWGLIAQDFDATVRDYEERGMPTCFSGSVPVGARFTYMDATRELGSMVEIIEYAPAVEAFFDSL